MNLKIIASGSYQHLEQIRTFIHTNEEFINPVEIEVSDDCYEVDCDYENFPDETINQMTKTWGMLMFNFYHTVNGKTTQLTILGEDLMYAGEPQ